MRFLPTLVTALLTLAPLHARAQDPAVVPGGGSLVEWLGLETGERFTYATADGEHVCVEVGRPVTLGDARYIPLVGMPWPALATDSRVYLPLDRTLAVGVIRTLTLRPATALDWLLEPRAARFLPRATLGEPGAVPGDGWFAIGGDAGRPDVLLNVWCAACLDAGRYVWMEQGRGITRVEERTITGTRRVTLISEGC